MIKRQTPVLHQVTPLKGGGGEGGGGYGDCHRDSAMAGSSQSESVAGRDPDVGAALLLDDGFDLVVNLLEAVAVHDA